MYVTEAQLAASDGASLVGFVQSGTDPQPENLESLLRNSVLATSFGADPTGASDSTAAITNALATSKNVVFPAGTYRAAGLEVSIAKQQLVALGPVVIQKNANGVLVTFSGRASGAVGLHFNGGGSSGFTGDNILLSVPECAFFGVHSINAGGAALRADSSSGFAQVFGGVWHTASGTNHDFEFEGINNQYNMLVGIKTSQNAGGIRASNGANVFLSNSQFGKFTAESVASIIATGCRIGGAITISSQGCGIDNCNVAASTITIGDGSTAISGVRLGPSNDYQNGGTLTINANVIESQFHLLPMQEKFWTLHLANTSPNNSLWHGPISYDCSWTAAVSAPTKGNGMLTASYSQNGRTLHVDLMLSMGSTTTFGAGEYRFSLPKPAKTNPGTPSIGSALLLDAGTRWDVGAAFVSPSAPNYFTVYTGNGTTTHLVPWTWTNEDVIRASVVYEVP